MSLEHYHNKGVIEAGCDEAGRGCLAGPVYAAAVILPGDFHNPELNDSKQLSAKKREKLRYIIEREAVTWSVAYATPEEIDEINIINASYLAMHRALDNLDPVPDHIIVDGKYFHPYRKIPYTCIIKGDGKYYSIAAASILAKTHRDELMEKIHNNFPYYNWNRNKGYPTREHRSGIAEHGISIWHRKSFRLLDGQLEIIWQNNR